MQVHIVQVFTKRLINPVMEVYIVQLSQSTTEEGIEAENVLVNKKTSELLCCTFDGACIAN